MAKFKIAFDKLMKLEFNDSSNAFHQNKGESGPTYKGIYFKAHPHWMGWSVINKIAAKYSNSKDKIKQISKEAYKHNELNAMVEVFYMNRYWTKMKLDQIDSQKITDEMFLFGVNTGTRTAVKKAQKIVGVTVDGIIGKHTLKALNEYNEDDFDVQFDEEEKEYYTKLIIKKPYLARFKRGWDNRAEFV